MSIVAILIEGTFASLVVIKLKFISFDIVLVIIFGASNKAIREFGHILLKIQRQEQRFLMLVEMSLDKYINNIGSHDSDINY